MREPPTDSRVSQVQSVSHRVRFYSDCDLEQRKQGGNDVDTQFDQPLLSLRDHGLAQVGVAECKPQLLS